MRGYDLRAALTGGTRVYGIGLEGCGQPKWPAIFAHQGLDFVFIDTEHTPINPDTLSWAVQTYAAHGVAPLVRIPEISAAQAAKMLDIGAHGVIAPYVETVAQVQQLAGAVKFRPLKGHALHAAVTQAQFPNQETADYLARWNHDAVLVIMIESPAGIEHLDAMLAVGEVDAVMLGPHDLSIALGVPEQYTHPEFEQALQHVIQVCRQRGVGVGPFSAGDVQQTMRWANWGSNMIIHRADTLFIADGITGELQGLRATLNTHVT